MMSPARVSHLVRTAAAGAVAMAIAMGFGRFSYTPILPGMMRDLGLTPADAGMIASANFLGYLIGAWLAGQGAAAGRERAIALSMLGATTLLLLAMGLVSDRLIFAAIRFLAGLSSALVMVMVSQIVLSQAAPASEGAAAGHVASAHFGGVGLGIALSSLMVWLLPEGAPTIGLAAWREAWLAGAGIAALGTLFVAFALPMPAAASDRSASSPAVEPRIAWTPPLVALTVSYGLFGFGYVITATFLVAMARQVASNPDLEFLSWLATGLSAAVSVALWRLAVPRIGLVGAYLAGLLLEAVGLVLSVTLPPATAPLVGGLMLGGTFLMITAFGLQIGRALAPQSPRRIIALMTVAFGIGQILGPLVAGRLAESSGTYTLPTLIAAAVLLASALIVTAMRAEITRACSLSAMLPGRMMQEGEPRD
ncbi:YbfB/YjiJ family MFS transporter [Rhizobium sp. YIM 134829]|uniref:YbfB/YjiJ family MFS transporter n=1 Tax=Rhizobium sp. YIM 134829 TaxID=3390453 RepID=UPI00397BD644